MPHAGAGPARGYPEPAHRSPASEGAPPIDVVLQVIVTGLAAGAGYGLLAIGLTLVHRLTGVVHLALGEIVGMAAVVALLAAGGGDLVAAPSVPAALAVGAGLAGVAAAAGVGGATYAAVARPFLRSGNALGWIGATVAVAFALRGLLLAVLARDSYAVPDPFLAGRTEAGVVVLGEGVTVPLRAFLVIGAGLLLAEAAARTVERTRWGRALRAVASEREGAHLTGLPVERLLFGAFALAGALAGVAAALHIPAVPFSGETGSVLGLKGLVAALVAGFGSPRRAFAAGLAVGLVEAAAASLQVGPIRLGPEYREIVPLALALVVLAWRRRATAVAE